MPTFFCMPFFACNRQIDSLDKRQSNLQTVPHEIERHSRTLEELLLDMNHIRELPKSLFRLHKLRRLGLSDNDIHRLPSEVTALQNLVELNLSRNDISDLPDDLKNCRNLLYLDVSCNPITRLPESITLVSSLTQLSLNDTSLSKLPQDIGRLHALRSLEVRENHLRALPTSIVQLVNLVRLDLGQNELDVLPAEIGALRALQELYIDDNSIESLPESILHCTALEQFDAASNRLLALPNEIGEMTALSDVTLSHNCLSYLPNSIGRLKRLSILRMDDNSFLQLTPAIGSCVALTELYLTQNLISELPSTIGNLQNLQNLNADKNQLVGLPPLIGECLSMTILSVRDNQIEELPMEIGKLSRLRVFDVSNNRLTYLPFTINVLFNLQALWISENQSQALLKLQQDVDPRTGMKVLTCYLLPQQSAAIPTNVMNHLLPNRSFVGGPKVHFGGLETGSPVEDEDRGGSSTAIGNFERHDTPHPKPGVKGSAKPSKKNSIDGHVIPHIEDANAQTTISLSKKPSSGKSSDRELALAGRLNGIARIPRPALKHSTASFHNQSSADQKSHKNVEFSSNYAKAEAEALREGCRLRRVNTPHYGKSHVPNLPEQRAAVVNNYNATSSASQLPATDTGPITIFSTILDGNNSPSSYFAAKVVNPFGKSVQPLIPSDHYQKFSQHQPDFQQQISKKEYRQAQQGIQQLSDGMLKTSLSSSANHKSGAASTMSLSVASSQPVSGNSGGGIGASSSSPSAIAAVIPPTAALTKRVVVRREPSHGLGLSIAGGLESNPYIEGDCGLFISKLIPNAPAERAGLHVGDKILEINGTSMINQRHDVAVDCIQKSPDVLNLIVCQGSTSNTELQQNSQTKLSDSSVTLQPNVTPNVISTTCRLNDQGLPPFSIRAESDAKSGDDVQFVVTRQSFGKSASITSATVEERDHLLSVNGVNVDGKSLAETLAMLRGAPGAEIYLLLQRNSSKQNAISNTSTVEPPMAPVRAGSVLQQSQQPLRLPSSHANSMTSLRNFSALGANLPSPLTNGYAPQSKTASTHELATSLAAIPIEDKRLDGTVEEVELRRDASNALGLSIVGGIDHCSHPFGMDAPGIFISKIAEGSPAAMSRRLRVGDRILSVNDCSVECARHAEAVDVLKKSGSILRLKIRHDTQPRGLREILFRRRDDVSRLGLTICGGINAPVLPSDPTDEGIFIDSVDPEGGAALDAPDLRAGMRILEVNDESLLGCTRSEAAALLRNASSPIRLLVCDGFLPTKMLALNDHSTTDLTAKNLLSRVDDNHITRFSSTKTPPSTGQMARRQQMTTGSSNTAESAKNINITSFSNKITELSNSGASNSSNELSKLELNHFPNDVKNMGFSRFQQSSTTFSNLRQSSGLMGNEERNGSLSTSSTQQYVNMTTVSGSERQENVRPNGMEANNNDIKFVDEPSES